jgi:hypothetical protein
MLDAATPSSRDDVGESVKAAVLAPEGWQSSRLSELEHLLMHDPHRPRCQEQRSDTSYECMDFH